MHLWNEENEAQNCVEPLELGITLEETVDLSEIENATKTKIHFSFLCNEYFHALQSPKISSLANHKIKKVDFQANKISKNFDETENKNTVFPERFS